MTISTRWCRRARVLIVATAVAVFVAMAVVLASIHGIDDVARPDGHAAIPVSIGKLTGLGLGFLVLAGTDARIAIVLADRAEDAK